MKLGQLLVKKRIIDEDQLRAVLARQKGEGARLGEMLVRLGLVSKRDVLSALATQPGFLLDSVALAQVEPAVAQVIPRQVAERLTCLAVALNGERLSVAMVDPLDFAAIEQLSAIVDAAIEPRLSGSSDIELAIRLHYPAGNEAALMVRDHAFPISMAGRSHTLTTKSHGGDSDPFGLVSSPAHPESLTSIAAGNEAAAGELPTSVQLQNLLLHEAIRARASDIHIEPRVDHLCVRNRVDGQLAESQIVPKWMHAGLISRFKVLANMDIAERRLPQDGRCRMQVEGRQIDLRVSTLPTRHGEKMVLRILDRRSQMLHLEDLGLDGTELQSLLDFIRHPQGMVLVVGPTGSGKTTTLYSLLQRMDSKSQNIITIEDPIEYEMQSVNQVQVQEKIGLNFAAILRSVLRQDPDIVLLGEIRDHETAQIAVRAALTGHLLLSTVHTNNAVGTLVRMLDLGVPPFLLSSSLLGVVSQRLVRRICRSCAAHYNPDPEALKILGLGHNVGIGYLRGRGCSDCGGRGYKGRIAIFEILRANDAMRQAISRNASEQELRRIAMDSGMCGLAEAGVAKVKAGLVTVEDMAYVVRDIDWSAVCPHCEEAIEPDFEICPHCGLSLLAACAGCGRQTQPGWQKCPYCRADLPKAETTHHLAAPAQRQDSETKRERTRELRALGPSDIN
ncbi:MAG: ATPase, T2SS/T4P/T4SS family [Acidobacteriota bacterium]